MKAQSARWDGAGFSTVTVELPETLGLGEVLVRVELATICGSDRHSVAGRRPSPTPVVLGHEQVGTVVAVGPNAPTCVDGAEVRPGMRVLWSVTASCGDCLRCRGDVPQKCVSVRKYGHERWGPGTTLSGGFATHCLLWPGTSIARVPDEVPDEVASPGSCATATVAAALRAARTGLQGARVLVTGAGMLGLTAAAMAAWSGAVVTVSARPSARRRRASAFGASEVVEPGEQPRGIDLAVETSGAASGVATCLASLEVGGTAVLTGSVTPGSTVPLDPQGLIRGLHSVTGIHNYRAEDLRAAVDFLAATHRVYPFAELVTGRFDLDDLDAAFGHDTPDEGAARQAVVAQRS